MQEMYDRLSGYDYKYEVESNVTKCSFTSYEKYYDLNPLIRQQSLDREEEFRTVAC